MQVGLQDRFPKADEQNSAGAAFSVFTPAGTHLSGFTQIDLGQASTMGRCAPDSTTCPAGPVDVDATFTNGRKTVTFFLDDPSDVDLDPATMTVRVQTASQVREGTPVVTADFPADGQPIPFTDRERNPVKKKAAKKKAAAKPKR